MAELATLARPYAKAAFDLARSADRLERWSRMLALLSAAAQTAEAKALIGTPTLPGEAKAHRLIGIVRDDLDDGGRRFVLVLADNKRLELLPEIAEQFEARKAQAEQILDVEIAAAVGLSETQMNDYAEALERRFSQQVNVSVTVDPSLVGGAVIRAGDTVIDGSVRFRLTRLVEALQRA